MENSSPVKRICIDARIYGKRHTGVGRYTRALIHHLQKIDTSHEYTVILTPEEYKEWPEDITYDNWRVEVLDIPHYSYAEQLRLLRYLHEEAFDLVHFTMFNHPILYTGPYVATIHDLTMSLYPLRPLWHPRTWAYRYTIRHAARGSKQVIVPSEATKRDVHRMLGVPEQKITVTYEAVEPEFRPQHDEKRFAELRKKYSITKPFLFFVNAWRPHKGLPDLIKAFEAVSNQCDLQLLIAGKPNPSFPQVISAVEHAKQRTADILTPGFIPDEDMITLYSMATAFVFPSHYEGFGLGALEAIACGCPTLAAKNSSLSEVLGDAALYFSTGKTQELEKAIVKLASDKKLQQELRRKGLEQAKNFSFDAMAKETLSVYKKALAA